MRKRAADDENIRHVPRLQRPSDASEPFPGMWALPGGIVDMARDRDLAACAARKLSEKTGIASIYLEQLGSWGSAKRDPRGWSATHAYFALIPSDAHPQTGTNAADVMWFAADVESLCTNLAFDYNMLINGDIKIFEIMRLRY